MSETVLPRSGHGKHETAARRRDLNTFVGWKNRPRNGKIARLPDDLRLRINRMLDDGLSYRDIVRKLHQETDANLPYPISEMNLSNWFHGGFKDWQREQLAPEVPLSLAVAASWALRPLSRLTGPRDLVLSLSSTGGEGRGEEASFCDLVWQLASYAIDANRTNSTLLKVRNSSVANERQLPRG